MIKYISLFIVLIFLLIKCSSISDVEESNSELKRVTFSSALNILTLGDTSRVTFEVKRNFKGSVSIRFSANKGKFAGEIKKDSTATNVKFSQRYYVPESETDFGLVTIYAEYREGTAYLKDSIIVSFQKDKNIPSPVFSPQPVNNSINLTTSTKLKWKCFGKSGSSGTNSDLTYDVFIGKTSNELKIEKKGLKADSVVISGLDYNTTYFWKVVAKYNDNNKSESDIWSFKTRVLPGGQLQDVDWKLVTKGTFKSGKDKIESSIDYDFEIMKYEVTNKQYAEFLNLLNVKPDTVNSNMVYGIFDGDSINATGNKYLYINLDKIKYENKRFVVASGFENHPVVNVTWIGANAFCINYRLTLPTLKEWEKAARGTEGWEYAFGNEFSVKNANYADSIITGTGSQKNAVKSQWEGTSPVGAYNGGSYKEGKITTIDSPSPYGIYDMSGNAAEWTNDGIKEGRVVAGGSYYTNFYSIKTWVFYQYNRLNSYPYIGFRGIKRK